MLKSIINVFRVPDLRNKILFTLLMLAIFRVGHSLPIPGIDQDAMKAQADKMKGNEIISGGHIQFVLTGPSGNKAATGSVTSSNDPKTPVGTKVTATVSGYNLELSFWPGTMFCASDTPANQWNCGA